MVRASDARHVMCFGKEDDTVGNPRRVQFVQFELFELTLLLKVDKQFPVEQFGATVSQSTVPSLSLLLMNLHTIISIIVVIISVGSQTGRLEHPLEHPGRELRQDAARS